MTALFIYAFLISFIMLTLVIFVTHKYELFLDKSNNEKPQNFHTKNTPRAGGIGILMGILLIAIFPFGLKFIFSIFIAFFSGIFEDFHNSLTPQFRLILQLFAALSAVFFTDAVVTYLGLGITMPYWVGIIFSVFAIVGMMNAINIIDGFNGLASGVILFILGSFAIVSFSHHDTGVFTAVCITSGATLGFFILNFPKGKIFLGDGGAYMLGFIVAILGIYLASTYDDISPWYIMAIFIYPVWEVLFSIIRRLTRGHSPLMPDGNHMHTLIYKHITKNNSITAMVIWLLILPSIILSTFYAYSSIINIIVIISFILLYTLLYYYLYTKIIQKQKI